MLRWTVPVVAAFVAVLLVAGIGGAVTVDPEDDETVAASRSTSSSTSTPGGSTTTAPVAGTIEEIVPIIQAFVERERGLRFKHPVEVTLLGDEEFEARVAESDEEDEEEIADAEAVLRAMDLLEDEDDLAAIVRSFTAGAVLGFYDPETEELVVRGARPTPFVRAHELLHALEDQNFDLGRLEDMGDEAAAGFQALAEGSAVRIEDRYRRTLSGADRRAADREERSLGRAVPDVPEVVEILFGFPYAYGPDLVGAIEEAGGRARLDAAYADPPSSSEHVLEPGSFLEGDKPKPVPIPAAEGAVFDDGEIGQLFLALMLRSEIDADDALDAADGWGGDHYVAWKDGDRSCVRMDFVMDSPDDTEELTTALAAWAARRDGAATATATSLRTCG